MQYGKVHGDKFLCSQILVFRCLEDSAAYVALHCAHDYLYTTLLQTSLAILFLKEKKLHMVQLFKKIINHLIHYYSIINLLILFLIKD